MSFRKLRRGSTRSDDPRLGSGGQKTLEKIRRLAQEKAVQDVDEAMREADFLGPHDPGQRMEILTQKLIGVGGIRGANFSQRDASDQAKRLLAKYSHNAAWICE